MQSSNTNFKSPAKKKCGMLCGIITSASSESHTCSNATGMPRSVQESLMGWDRH